MVRICYHNFLIYNDPTTTSDIEIGRIAHTQQRVLARIDSMNRDATILGKTQKKAEIVQSALTE
jgi:hypothetical protein